MSAHNRLSAAAAAGAIARGELRATELLEDCLARIAARDDTVHAWACLDAEGARAAARACDTESPRGPLHGVPVGIKDVIDVAGLPSGYGCAAFAGNIATRDADCVARLRAAGAIILGKTVTAEFATYHPGPTANPLRPAHTPGGSSSGSAAAVADLQVPLALGTQTAGSIIRPASYCGVIGFKPSFGRYAIPGMLVTAPHLDTLGALCRDVDDLLLLDAVLAPQAAQLPLRTPLRVGICRSPAWESAGAPMQEALAQAADALRAAGVEVAICDLGPAFDTLIEQQSVVHRHECFLHLGAYRREHADAVSAVFREFIDAGAQVSAADYRAALAQQARCREELLALFAGFSLLLTPAATGTAPTGHAQTGSPVFNRIWTAVGAPCIGFPAARGDHGLPLGLQFVAPPGADRAALAAIAPLVRAIGLREMDTLPEQRASA